MKRLGLLFPLLFITSLHFSMIQAQNWMKSPYLQNNRSDNTDPAYSFYDIQSAFKKYEEDHSRVVNGEWKNFPGYKVFKRWENYMEPRVYPSGDLSLPSRMMGEHLAQTYFGPSNKSGGNSNNSGFPKPYSSTGNWSPLGPFGANFISYWGGTARLNFVRLDPVNPNIIWVGSPTGGLWKSIDAGANWFTATDNLAQLGCSDIAIDPTNSNIMYMATGDADGFGSYLSVSSLGILKSVDGGLNWAPTALSYPNSWQRTIYRILINPDNPLIVLVASNNGIYRSTDGGVTWPIVAGTGGLAFTDIEFNPQNPNTVFTTSGINWGGTFYRSLNGGQSFSVIAAGLPAPGSLGRCQIGVTAIDTNKVYFLAANTSNTFYGFYLSNNGGTSFSLQSNSPNILAGGISGQAWYDIALDISPINSSVVAVGGIVSYISTDAGVTWSLNGTNTFSPTIPFIHPDQHAALFLPGSDSTYFMANDGGLWKTTDLGSSWTNLHNGLQISQMYRLGTYKKDPGIIMTGLQDMGNHYLNGANWSLFALNTGDAMECIIDRDNDSIIFLSSYNGKIIRTINKGLSFSVVVANTGAGVNAASNWTTPNIVHPTQDSTLLVGKAQVYRTTNLGTTWSQVGSLVGGSGNLVDLAYAPSDPDYIYAAKRDKIFVSSDGTTFGDSTGILPVGSARITAITVCNTDPRKVWVSFSGYSAANKVWHSSNSGSSWSNVSAGLPNLPVNSLTYQNNTSNGVYAGTDAGIYFKSDSLASWKSFNNGLPNVDVEEMEIAYSIYKIRAATNGRGLWESDLAIPDAFFTPATICANTPTIFSDESVGNPTSWLWSFPGGIPVSSTLANPSVVFTSSGPHTATLTSGNDNGSSSISISFNVTAPADGLLMGVSGDTLTSPYGLPSYWYLAGTPGPLDSASTYVVSVSGDYYVVGIDSNGCTASSDTTFVNHLPLAISDLVFLGSYDSKEKWNHLHWEFKNTSGMSRFEVLRSNDSNYFTQIGQIVCENKNGLTADYSFNDQMPVNGNNFYQLRWTDMNNQSGYSQIISVNVINNSSTLLIYPNPVSSNLTVEFLGKERELSIHLVNTLGQDISQQIKVSQISNRKFEINVEGISSGLYSVTIKGEQGHILANKSFIRQ